jgi:Fe2+ transport system protein FeoA
MNFNFNIGREPRQADSGVPLTALTEGRTGRIVSVDIDDSHDLERLEVMGLCPGRIVEIVKRGDPMIVRVLSSRIGLAAVLAERVAVRPDEGGDLG